MDQHSPLMILIIAEFEKRQIPYNVQGETILCPLLKIKLHPATGNPERDVGVYIIDSWHLLSCYLGWDDTISFQTEAFTQKHLEGVTGQS
jgi:hypothetical protein